MKKFMQMVFISLTVVSATSVVAIEVENPLAIASQYRRYNLLPEVEDSSLKLKENGNLESFLRQAREVAIKYDIENILGFRLIHHHFNIEENEKMIESYVIGAEGQKALITKAESQSVTLDAFPASWIKTENGWEVFEYSRDKEVKKSLDLLSSLYRAIQEIYTVNEQYNLNNLLAPSILAREWDASLSSDDVFLEQSYIHPVNQSVVTIENSITEAFVNIMITTAWKLSSPITHKCVGTFYCEPDIRFNRHYKKLGYHNPYGSNDEIETVKAD